MANPISLQSSVRTCKVNTGWADKIQSDRFINKNSMMCPVWNGIDTTGRRATPDSFMTKSMGCNSAMDRVLVENAQRPQYSEYMNLNTNGFDNTNRVYGNFGLDMKADTIKKCSNYPYEAAMSSLNNRNDNIVANAYNVMKMKQSSGF